MKQGVNGGTTLCQFSTIVRMRSPRSSIFRGERRGIAADHIVHALLILLFMLLPYGALAEEGRGYLDFSGGYKTGDFGTPTRSNLYYLAPTLGYVAPQYDVSVTIPYLSLTNKTAGVSTTETGIGDIILRGGRVLVPEGEKGLSLYGSLAVKLPTADENKGLGTGKTDYGAFLSLYKRIESVKLAFLGGYIITGNSSSFNYNDIYLYGVGVSKIFGRTDLYASLEGRRSSVAGAANPLELNLGFLRFLSKDYSLKGNTFFGLTDGSPDFGVSLGILRWF
jgi:hypothetical protein